MAKESTGNGKYYNDIMQILSENRPFKALTEEEKSFMSKYETAIEDAEDEEIEFIPKPEDKEKYDGLSKQVKENKDALEFQKVQVKKAYAVKLGIREEYSKISPFKRFFSHFVPNSLTEAGRLRDKMAQCDKAYKDSGWNKDDIEKEYYKNSMNEYLEGLYETGEQTRMEKSSWTKGSLEKKKKEYAKQFEADAIDLTEIKKDDIVVKNTAKEKITVNEASTLNKQTKVVKAKDEPSKVVENVKVK